MSDALRGFVRGLVIVALQALGVLMIEQRSVAGSFCVSGGIALAWLQNVQDTARGRGYWGGFVLGSALGSAGVVWGAQK